MPSQLLPVSWELHHHRSDFLRGLFEETFRHHEFQYLPITAAGTTPRALIADMELERMGNRRHETFQSNKASIMLLVHFVLQACRLTRHMIEMTAMMQQNPSKFILYGHCSSHWYYSYVSEESFIEDLETAISASEQLSSCGLRQESTSVNTTMAPPNLQPFAWLRRVWLGVQQH